MEVTKSAHSVYSLKYHVVWVCKYRRRILNPALVAYLSSVGIDEKIVRSYVEYQGKQDSGQLRMEL
jgi:putative transposase